ncbi:MAG: hypothetical protein WEB58_11175 [Planctomycetaceae bacterium]
MFSRSLLIGAFLLIPTVVGLGCASGTQSGWGGARSVAKQETETESEPEATPPAQKTPPLFFKKRPNPFLASADDAAKTETSTETADSKAKPDVVHAEAEENGATSSGRDATQPVSHDAELLKRINTELKDLPAKERAALFHNLKMLDPAMVDQVLKMRRMSREISEKTTNSPSPVDGGGYSQSSPGNASADVTVSSPRSGLGNGNPWESPSGPKTETLMLGESKPIQPPPRRDPQLPRITPSGSSGPQPIPSVDEHVDSSSIAADDAGASNIVSNAGLTANAAPSLNSQTIVFPPEAGAAPESGVINVSTGSSTQPLSQKASIESLIARTEQELATLPLGTTPEEQRLFLEKHVFLRMLYWMGKQQERALQPIPGIDPADQEFWQQVFWAMTNYFDAQTIPNEADRAAQTLVQLRAAVQRLQEKAKLEIHNVAFCHKITSFGNYERFNRDEFTPGQPVLLYGEMVNFKSEPTADGQYRTILKSTLEIYRAGAQGELVERIPFPATEDLCRQPRTDYFHSYEFTIPQRITLGPHVLKLVVEDQLSQKLSTYSINFMVK